MSVQVLRPHTPPPMNVAFIIVVGALLTFLAPPPWQTLLLGGVIGSFATLVYLTHDQ